MQVHAHGNKSYLKPPGTEDAFAWNTRQCGMAQVHDAICIPTPQPYLRLGRLYLIYFLPKQIAIFITVKVVNWREEIKINSLV